MANARGRRHALRRIFGGQEDEAAALVAEETGAVVVTCGECQQEIPSDQFEEHWAAEHSELQAGPKLSSWDRFTGWVADFGRKLVSRTGLTLSMFLCALVAVAFSTQGLVSHNDGRLVAGAAAGIVFGIIALCLAAPLAGIDLAAYASRITRWRPKWQRPSWLRMPSIGRPQIRRPQVQLHLSWPSRLPRPSRAWLVWGPAQQRMTAVVILAVVLVVILALWPSPTPTTEPAAVVEEPAAEPTVAAVAPVTPETTTESATEPTAAPVEEVKVVEPGPSEPAIEPSVEAVSETEGGESTEVVEPVGTEAEAAVEVEQEVEVVVEAETAVETAARTEAHIVTVESGDTVWDLLAEALGCAPTWDQIQQVVDANDLVDKGVNEDGLWIVIVQPGQTLDLASGLASG